MKIHIIWLRLFKAVGYGFGITLLFIFSLALLAAYGQPFLDWMDSSPQTGIVLLGVGSVAYVACFFYGVITKR